MSDALGPPGLSPRLRLAGLAMLWERLWPALWPALAVIGLFLTAALFDLPTYIPGWLHAALLAVAVVVLGITLFRAAHLLRLPRHAQRVRRIETASGLAHRPLAALEDRLAGTRNDAGTAALWEIHRRRMAEAAKRLRIGVPAAGLVKRDPLALRVALGLLLIVAAVDAGRDWSDRLRNALLPNFSGLGPGAGATLDIWVTPPEYTGLPPLFLRADSNEKVPVPTGSTVLAQVHGGSGLPRLLIDGKGSDFERIDEANAKGSAVIAKGSRLAVEQDSRTLAAWPINVIPDYPPTIAFARPPSHTQRGVLRLDYKASDDYGVEGVRAIIKRTDDPSGETITLDMPLPAAHAKDAQAGNYFDLTAHLWAGMPVEIKLQAWDALNQVGESEAVQTTLPERQFHHPVAKALVEQRKELTRHPQDRKVVAETLSDLSLRPQRFGDDVVVFLALRTAQARLQRDERPVAIPAIQALLWDTALRIEDGRSTLSQRDLRQAMQALQDALARNAPDDEIARRMQELQQAIDRYMQALADNMLRQPMDPNDMQPLDPSQMLSRQDIQRMLDQARNLARTGNREQAREMLSRLQQMLENLQAARPGQMRNGQSQAMRGMQDLMHRQQQLLDKSFRQSRQGQQQGRGQQQDMQGDAAQQEALRRTLGDLMRQMGENGQEVPGSLGRAQRSMQDAADALRRGQPGQATGPQTDALDGLQQAFREMAEQMARNRNGGQPGGDPGDDPGLQQAQRDPFGRMPQDEQNNGGLDDGGVMRMGKSANDYALEKAKEILDLLRQRAGERTRPELERDYIDRLLKQF